MLSVLMLPHICPWVLTKVFTALDPWDSIKGTETITWFWWVHFCTTQSEFPKVFGGLGCFLCLRSFLTRICPLKISQSQ